MAFSAAYASRLTTRLAPGALTTAALLYATERGTCRASQQAVTAASRQLTTTAASRQLTSGVTNQTSPLFRWNNNLLSQRLQRRSLASSTTTEGATTSKTAATTTTANTPPPPPADAAKKSFSFVAWYEGHLQARPIPTKMVTGSILWSLGDAVAQVVPATANGTLDMSNFTYDWIRTGRAFAFGCVLHAPASHVHFNFLEWMTVRAGVTGMGIPVFKAFMEQFVYWSWVSNSMYHAAMGYMQGMNTTQVIQKIKDVLWDTQKAQWVFWIPVQLLNFQFVPVRHQLNVVLLTSVVWTAFLSAAFPPEPVVAAQATPVQKEQAQIKRRLSMITQQSGGGPADPAPK